jgi:Bax protein
LLLQNKNIVSVTIALVAISILVPGVLKVGPPQWLHTPDTLAESVESDVANVDKAVDSDDDSNIDSNVAARPAINPDMTKSESAATKDAPEDVSVAATASAVTANNAKPADKMNVSEAGTAKADVEPPASSTTSVIAETLALSPKETVTAEKDIAEKSSVIDDKAEADTKLAANMLTPRESLRDSLKKTTAPKASKPDPKVPPVAVARSFVHVIPASHADLATPQQKEQFIKMVLPLILAANEEIIQRRAAIRRAYDRKDAVTLGKWAKLYKLPPENGVNQAFLNELLARADVIPVPLALAQAAIESGWGTSRFARQGNALFGQWAWQEDVGIKPLHASNKNAVVRSFPNLLGSVRAYMHNLNTHQAYQDLRDSRKRLAKMPKEDKANVLVNHLNNYAEIGMQYVKDLKIVMRKNKLRDYANAFLS